MASCFILGVAITTVHQHLNKLRLSCVKNKMPHASQLSLEPLCSPSLSATAPKRSALSHSFLTSHSCPDLGLASFCPCHSPEIISRSSVTSSLLNLSSALSSWQHLPPSAISCPQQCLLPWDPHLPCQSPEAS